MFKEVDCLDISHEGEVLWENVVCRYEEQISRIETQLASRLRDQLGGSKNAKEMFAIFSRFNALFVRPHIRSAIREYQTKLIERVKEDISQLRAKFTLKEEEDKANMAAKFFDLPPLIAQITWIKLIERQLSMYMKRIEDILGKGSLFLKDGVRYTRGICTIFIRKAKNKFQC